jgi:hypothetical protein
MWSKHKNPSVSERRRLANVMEGRAMCQVSGRWLQFPEAAQTVGNGYGTASFMVVDVMTKNIDDVERKICELVLTKEDLLHILNRMPVKE